MAIWDKLRSELDRAGRAAQDALDEGRIRLDAFRARQQADKAAQAIGYAVFRARQEGRDVDPEVYARLASDLAAHEAEARRLEARVAELGARRKGGASSRPSDAPGTHAPGTPGAPPPASSAPEAGTTGDSSTGANI